MKTPLVFLAGALSGLILGAGAMLIAFPFLFPPPVLDEPPPAAVVLLAPEAPMRRAASAQPAPDRIASAAFDRTSPGRDALHWANGTAGLYRQGDRVILRLEGDFVAGPGPDFHLYLNTGKVGDEAGFLADAGRVRVARLRAFRGGQNYLLPPGIDLAAVRSVTIWCDRFAEFIGNASFDGRLT